jgi:hypothetical protein
LRIGAGATRSRAPLQNKKSTTGVSFVGNRTDRIALQKRLGVSAMPSSAYFRRQADICLRLSLIASDEEVSNRLIKMSREYLAKGDALAGGEADAGPPLPDHEPGSPSREIEPDAAGQPLQMQASRVDS